MPKYFCYLVRSQSSPTTCYVGFTVNPSRRIRQHNGEIKCGARKTSKKRPWKFELIVSGFANNIIALMFEWQFQHPKTSRHGREAESSLNKPRKQVNSLHGHLLTLCLLLSNPLWKQCDLSVSFLEQSTFDAFKKILLKHQSSPSISVASLLNIHDSNRFKLVSIEDLNTVHRPNSTLTSIAVVPVLEGMCSICFQNTTNNNNNNNSSSQSSSSLEATIKPKAYFQCNKCHVNIHLICLARKERDGVVDSANVLSLVPANSTCYSCHTVYAWTDIVRNSSHLEKVNDKISSSTDASQQHSGDDHDMDGETNSSRENNEEGDDNEEKEDEEDDYTMGSDEKVDSDDNDDGNKSDNDSKSSAQSHINTHHHSSLSHGQLKPQFIHTQLSPMQEVLETFSDVDEHS